MSGSQDCTLKCWTLKVSSEDKMGRLKVKYTQLAHDKVIVVVRCVMGFFVSLLV